MRFKVSLKHPFWVVAANLQIEANQKLPYV